MSAIALNELEAELARLRAVAHPPSLPYACGAPLAEADFRAEPGDFRVAEQGFEPSGSGEHLLLRVRKTGQNTRWVAKRLAESLQLPYRMVSYAGLKDRNAVTEQWFSAHIPGLTEPDLTGLDIEGVDVLAVSRHDKKLRPGQLSYNEFDIRLRNCKNLEAARLAEQVARIEGQGAPNFFGEQRFGRELGNLSFAARPDALRSMGREQRSFVISALRGALFNGYLAERVAAGSWSQPLADEITISDRSRGVADEDRSVFEPMRLPTGLLWGNAKGAQLMPAESAWYGSYPAVGALLEAAGSRASRRVLVCRVADFRFEVTGTDLRIGFKLGSGAYATTVLRELIHLNNVSQTYES